MAQRKKIKMKLHWMSVFDDTKIPSLVSLYKKIDESHYNSVLFVYHSLLEDFWITIANTINLSHKFKYMLAIRTYAISPEYFVMMYKAFNNIAPGRLMFNIVAGDIQKTENSINNLIFLDDHLKTSEQRVEYTRLWLKKVKELMPKEIMPQMVMSGTSDNTLKYAEELADYNLSMIDSFMPEHEKYLGLKNVMVCAAIVIRDSDEEAEEFLNTIEYPHHKKWTIFGNEEQVLKKIIDIKQMGATDLLIRRHENDEEYERIHAFVKKHKGEIK